MTPAHRCNWQHATITDNWATYNWGKAIEADRAPWVTSSIIAGNGTSGYEILSWTSLTNPLTSGGGNIVGSVYTYGGDFTADYDQRGVTGAQLKLGALANNGGSTQTHLPASDSPAIDAGHCAGGRDAGIHDGPARPRIPGRVGALPSATPGRSRCRA